MVGMAGVTPALLDPTIDSGHWSFLAVVQHQQLNVLHPRPPAELVPVDPRWVPGDMSSIFCFRLLYISLYNVLTFVHYMMQAERGRSSYCGSSC